MTHNWIRLFVAALAVMLVATACGGDDEDDTEATDTPAPTEQAADGDLTTFCSAIIDAEAQVIALSQGEEADPTAALEEAEATAPEDIATQVQSVVAQAREAIEKKDDSVFESEEFRTLDEEIDQYVFANCGLENMEVTASEYAFSGAPDSIPAGEIGINFTNGGEESHELILARINDPSKTVEDILDMPEKEQESAVTVISFLFAQPGESDAQAFELEPGEYAMVCFVSVGTTPEKDGTGPPHVAKGMYGQFTVE